VQRNVNLMIKKIFLLILISFLLFLSYIGASKHIPMQFSSEIIIKQSIDKTIALWQDKNNYQYWQDGFISKELISGTKDKKGAVSIIKLKQGNGEMELKETVMSSNLPTDFKVLIEHHHMSNTMNNHFIAIDENTTLWKTEINYFKVNFWPAKVMMRLFPKMFKKQGEKWWNQFKDFAEKQ